MSLNFYPAVKRSYDNSEILFERLVSVANNAAEGKINCAVEFTPALGAVTTEVIDQRITPNSVLLIEPTSDEAALIRAPLEDRSVGRCTLTHSTAAAGETFRLIILA
jgi:hypothetical protein